MAQTDEIQLIPPHLERRVRRWEWVSVCVLVALLLLTGLAYTTGLLETAQEPAPYHRARFRPLVADLRGAVEFRPVGAGEWRDLRLSDTFEEGDQVRTGAKASCDILLTWRTGFTIASQTVLTWKTLATRGEARDVEIILTRGKILASLDALPKGSEFYVTTPHSRTLVKGTVLAVEAREDVARTIVLRGVVEVVDRSDPTRLVEVAANHETAHGPAGDGSVVALTAERRAQLLAEDARLRRNLERLSPSSEERHVAKGKVTFSAREPLDERPSSARDSAESSSSASLNPGARSDAEAVEGLLRRGLTLLERGRIEEALGLCTTTFRATLWGALVERSGVSGDLSREEGDEGIMLQFDRLQAALRLEFEVLQADVSIDQGAAYGSLRVRVIATTLGEGEKIERGYACSARCVKEDGRWLVDLAMAMEGQRAR